MTIAHDVSRLEVSHRIELFVLDVSSLGGEVFRFVPDTTVARQPVVWQGVEYQPMPIEVSGMELKSDGPVARPRLRVANPLGLLGALVRQYERLEGCSLVRKQTLVKYLDAVNFPGGNDLADPDAHYPDETWFFDRITNRNRLVVEWELCSAMDLTGVMLPRRQVMARVCTVAYRSPECGYAGGAVARADDSPTGDLAQDVCGHRIWSCKLRFGATAELPFGGFPGAGVTRNV